MEFAPCFFGYYLYSADRGAARDKRILSGRESRDARRRVLEYYAGRRHDSDERPQSGADDRGLARGASSRHRARRE